VRGIEGRSARVAKPGWVHPLLALRGALGLFDRRLLHDAHVHAAIARAEREAVGATPGLGSRPSVDDP